MPTVSGSLISINRSPSTVAGAWVRAKATRPFEDGLLVGTQVPATINSAGVVTFEAVEGPGVLVLQQHNGPPESIPILVPTGGSATLRECVEAVMLADEGTISALERLALEVTGMVATIQNITQLEEWADTARTEAGRAKGEADRAEAETATIPQEVQTALTTSLAPTIQTELDTRVPPEVAEALSTDQTIRNAATLAVNDAVNAGLPGKADTTYVDAQDQALGQRITDGKWNRDTDLSNTSYDLNAVITLGTYRVSASGVKNLPTATTGVLEVLASGGGDLIQRFTSRFTLTTWQRRGTAGGATWYAWEDISRQAKTLAEVDTKIATAIDGIDIDTPEADPAPVGLKTVPLALTTGQGGSGETSGTYRLRAQFGAPITRYRLHISTRHTRWASNGGPITLSGVKIGHRGTDVEMTDPQTLLDGPVTVAGGDEWVSPWLRHDFSKESLIEYSFTTTGTTQRLLGAGWKWNGTTWVRTTEFPQYIWVEAETYEHTPVIGMIGDSTGAGVGATWPVWDSALYQKGREQGFLPILWATSGDTLTYSASIEDRNFARWEGFDKPDSVIIQAGSNDVHGDNATLADMQARYAAAVDTACQLAPVVFGSTIKPRYTPTEPSETVRQQFNEWVKGKPLGLRDVIDFSHSLAPTGQVDAADNTDGSHLSTSGHTKMAGALHFPVARPSLVTTTGVGSVMDARIPATLALRLDTTVGTRIMAGDTMIFGDTGWRNINSLITGVEFSGSVLVRRRAEWLDFRFAWFNPTGVANVSFTLPTGWRGVNNDGATLLNGSGAYAADLRIGWAGDVTVRRTATQSLDCTVSIPAQPTWPGSYIGTPA